MDLNRQKFEKEISGRKLTFEVSRLAEQANAAVLATYGGTTVLATVVMGKEDREINFMPLTVDYEEKYYAAGKILGSRFIRREGRPSDEAILSGRLVDRAIRPLFDSRLRRDIQVTITVLSYDEENDPDFTALNAVSLALGISDIPWNGPVAGLRIAKNKSGLIINPTQPELKDTGDRPVFSSFVAGRGGKINMIELEANEAKDAEIIESYKRALAEIDGLIDLQESVIKKIGRPKSEVVFLSPSEELKKEMLALLSGKLEKAILTKGKPGREDNLSSLKKETMFSLGEKGFSGKDLLAADIFLEELTDKEVHRLAIESNQRPDGRKFDEIRELYAETGLLARTHGSALFIRGSTQSLAVATLGAPGSEQMIETMEESIKRRFMLHYNFPQYSVGEPGSFRGPKRRDIGHGALAEKAIRPMLPEQEDFPYAIRLVSEILSSNGSSSMATVCAGSLALMDAGVPLKKPVAGIAVGMMSDKSGRHVVLTDIQGPEDHYGDMDFKAAGTEDGINAIQMDVKIEGINLEVMEEVFAAAEKARKQISDLLVATLPAAKEISPFAPKISLLNIDPSKIGEVIGPGGKVINGIIERSGALSIDIEEDGRVYISAKTAEALEAAEREIKGITKIFEVGEIIEGKVIKILDFGAIIDLGGGKDGMVHVSELKDGFVKKVTDVVNLGDTVRAKIIRAEPDGKVGLSLKQLSTQ
jgi:polyribonucleotide nucleotidyltransferase